MEQQQLPETTPKSRASKYLPDVVNVRGLGLVDRRAAKLLLRDYNDYAAQNNNGASSLGLIEQYIGNRG